MSGIIGLIQAQRVLPVIRSADADDAEATGRACARAGMNVVELTYSTPDVAIAVRRLASDGITVGLGTITEVEQVHQASAAGAGFAVSFANVPGLIEAAGEHGLTAIPGATTPTEVWSCLHAGAEVVKLFPARLLAPSYLGDLRALFPELRAIVTGGIGTTKAEVSPWLVAGALAVGIGSALGSASADGDAEVERRARAAVTLANASVASDSDA